MVPIREVMVRDEFGNHHHPRPILRGPGLARMPPKAAPLKFAVDGVWFVQNGNLWNSVREPSWPSTLKKVVVKADSTTTSDATRDLKIRKAPGFAALKALVAPNVSDQVEPNKEMEQPAAVDQPAKRSSSQISQRELASLDESLPMDHRSSVQPDHFMHSEYSQRDDYEAQRLGSRHVQTRDVTYAEATQKLEEMGLEAEAWLHEVRRIVTQMDIILDEIPPEHAAAARALQSALLDMIVEAEDEDDETEEGEPVCEPCDTAEPTDAECRAAAYFEEVTEAVGWSTEDAAPPSPPLAVLRASRNGCDGGLLLTHFELLWIKAGCHFSDAQLRVPLREIERASPSLFKSPFGSRAELLIGTRGEQVPMSFACGSALADVELFSLELATAVAAIPGTARLTTTSTASTAAADVTAPRVSAAAAPARRQTKQRLAAADLRQKLKQVVELQRSHAAGSSKEAARLLAELQATPEKAPSIHTAYKQSEHLRDIALGFGGYAQARLVIEQFLKMPVVKLLLPDVLRELQQSSSDVSVAMELMGHAKQFFTEIFGVGFRGGRRCDEDRNAYAAASAAILPRDLFAKRGRAAAASRLTGLGYRQMHRGSDERRELEDRFGGWKRVRTADHLDRIDWGPLKDAWHTDLLSTEDNQNKDMVSATARPLVIARTISGNALSLAWGP